MEALLMGPNNAGKSTIINALRLCSAAGRLAMRSKAVEVFNDGRYVRGFRIRQISDDGFNLENVRHEFQEKVSRLDLDLSTGASIHMVWPLEEEAFFWVEANGVDISAPMKARPVLEKIGLVPTLTPLEREERKLGRDNLKKYIETKQASRHFRNNLRAVQEDSPADFDHLMGYLLENTPELTQLTLVETYREGETWLDLYYRDSQSRTEKEIFWAGDGLQIWLQLLFHLWRTRDLGTAVLDEPDVFLHPELQRRLVRVLEATGRQTILSSHAAEVASEASQSSIVWIERGRRQARRLTEDVHLEEFSGVLGSAFNLAIAKALKARVALFVEGDDMKILRTLAKKLGCVGVAAENGVAVVGIGGFSHWPSVEAFTWIKSQFLGSRVRVWLLLDRDYRSLEAGRLLVARMKSNDVSAHVWSRKELESYLLEPAAIARVSGISVAEVEVELAKILEGLKAQVAGQFSKTVLESKESHVDVATALGEAAKLFERDWLDPSSRLAMAPAKTVIAAWNTNVPRHGGAALNPRRLAAAIKPEEIDPEVADFLISIESALVETAP